MTETKEGRPPGLPSHSRFFTVRLWREDLGQGRSEWRGRVQNVASNEVRFFRDWPGLIACLQEMIGGDPHSVTGQNERI
jgi:hypothetical protein